MNNYKFKYHLPLLISVLFFLSSCSIGYHGVSFRQSTSLTPNIVKLDLTSKDIDFLGATTINVSYHKYLGVFESLDSINNKPYEKRHNESVVLRGMRDIRLSNHLRKASAKIIETYPNADYFVVINKRRETQKMFMGSFISEEATIKCYKSNIK